MVNRIKKHVPIRIIPVVKKRIIKSKLIKYTGTVPLNVANQDRIVFVVSRDDGNNIRIVDNIRYEINIEDKWEWVVRYDDHAGEGSLHRHYRVDLVSDRQILSKAKARKYKNKNHELTWVCNDFRKNHQIYRKKFLTNCGLDLY